MRIFVIDDNEQFALALWNQFSHAKEQEYIPFNTSEFNNTHALSDTIIESLHSEDVLFINVNLAVGKEKRLDRKGIRLLTWLRTKGVKNHCVLYSFESLNTIAKSAPKNLLLFSQGNTFVQLPDDFSSIDLRQIKNDFTKEDNLKTYLKALFEVAEFRHREANWWSVKVLWDIHRVATKGTFNEDYPQSVKDNLSILNNAVGVFLNELKVINVSKYIEDALNKIRNRKSDLEEQLIRLKSDQDSAEFYNEQFSKIGEELTQLNKDIQHLVGKEGYKEYMARRATLQNDLNFIVSEITSIENAKPVLAKITEEIKHYENSLLNISASVEKELFSNKRKPSADTTANILLIDDNAENGWMSVYRHIFPNATIQSVELLNEYEKSIDKLYYYFIKPAINNIYQTTSLIFLDLRLFEAEESERSIDVENLSGKLMLEKIREDFKGIPIIITTASNKVWTFQRLVNAGTDAYWVKEGFDEQRTAEDSVNNYLRLLDLVNKMTDERYQLLREFALYAEKFDKEKNKHWSKTVKWLNGEKPPGNVNAISKTLKDSVSVLRNYLHDYHLGYGYKDQLNEAFVISGLINKIAGVYESVHAVDQRVWVGVDFYELRGDTNQTPLRDLRNDASHNWYHLLTWNDLKRCIKETMNYLDTKQGF